MVDYEIPDSPNEWPALPPQETPYIPESPEPMLPDTPEPEPVDSIETSVHDKKTCHARAGGQPFPGLVLK